MFTVNELIRATQGKLICGKPDAVIQGICIDSRIIKKAEAFVAIKGHNFDGHDFIQEAINKGASCIIVESKVKSQKSKVENIIEVKDTTRALGDIACYQRSKFDIPLIAVTGSNGKTTTKEVIARVLSKKFKVLKNEGTKNNHIGLPLTLLKLNSSYDIAVLEVGTNHFGEIDYLAKICQPNIGVITNIGPSHLEHLKSLEGVFKEKCSLLKYLRKPAISVLNADDGFLRKIILNKEAQSISFGIKNKSDFTASAIKHIGPKVAFSVNPALSENKLILKNPGRHNVYNALAAIAIGRIFGIEYKDIALRINSFDFLSGRMKLMKFNNINFIDDSYNSNPLSLTHALETLLNFKARGRKILVMGDMLELGLQSEAFHRKAGSYIAGAADILIAVGRLSHLSAESASSFGLSNKKIFTCKSAPQAREILFNKVFPDKNDIILIKGSRGMKLEEILK